MIIKFDVLIKELVNFVLYLLKVITVFPLLMVSTVFSLIISCARAIPVENSKTKKVRAILLFMNFIVVNFECIILKL